MTVSLNDYLKACQRLARDSRQDLLNPSSLISYINMARREVAMRTQCIRVLTPISGSVLSASITAVGSSYTTATVTISAPDFPSGTTPFPGGSQATATPLLESGTFAAVDIQYGGYGYFQPTASVTGNGTGASVTLQVTPINTLNANQEVYPFSGFDLTPFPGVESIFMIRSVAIIYSNYRFLPVYRPFSIYQTERTYPFQYTYVPVIWSQFGQGTGGSLYGYPLPSQTYQLEIDAYGIPQDLETNLSVEAIPQPWTDSVKFMALYFAYLDIQNFNVAKFYDDQFEKWVQRQSNYARPGRSMNPYLGARAFGAGR